MIVTVAVVAWLFRVCGWLPGVRRRAGELIGEDHFGDTSSNLDDRRPRLRFLLTLRLLGLTSMKETKKPAVIVSLTVTLVLSGNCPARTQ